MEIFLGENSAPGQVVLPKYGQHLHDSAGAQRSWEALNGLRCREEAWRNTVRYLETGESATEFFLAEECRNAEEARGIAEHYQRIIASIEAQMEAQR